MGDKQWGTCGACFKWGEAPEGFDERYHFMKCECGQFMYLNHLDPKDAAYRDKDKIVPKIVRQP